MIAGSPSINLGSIQTKHAELSDVDRMVLCHIAAFPGQFMTEMGMRWLKGLYSHFIRHDRSICIVAVDKNQGVIGFAIGGDPAIRDKFLCKAVLRYSHLLFWRFLTVSIVRRKLLAEIPKRLGIGRRASASIASSPQTTNVANSGDLVSVAVYPQYQGTGVAGQLIESFQKESAKKGYDILTLGVYTSNLRAIGFYKKHGWKEVCKYGTHTKFQLDLNDK